MSFRVARFGVFVAILAGLGPLGGCRERPSRGPAAPKRRHVLLITVDTLRADYVGKRCELGSSQQPGARQPRSQQPDARQPGPQQPGSPQPPSQQPGAQQPAARHPGARQPASQRQGSLDHNLQRSGPAITPFIDSLREVGFSFTHALTPIPRTTQALASLLTGCYPQTTRLRRLWDSLAPEVLTLAQLARRGGYKTVAVVSNQVLIRKRGLDRGFDVYDFAPDTRGAAATTAAAIRRLGRLRRSDAIFAWVHYIDPHVPYYPPPELARRFDPDYRGRYRLHFGAIRGGMGDLAYPIDLPKPEAVFRNPLPEAVNAHIRRLYAADIRHADDQIARLVGWVRSHLGDDWLIVYAADHGESLGEHDYYYDHGDYVYNATLRVPLVFVFPEGDPLRRAGSCPEWVSLVDVMPTLAELLGLRLPPDLGYRIAGRSLVPYLRGEGPGPRPVFAECGRSHYPKLVRRRVKFSVAGRFRAVVWGDWKLIWTPGQTPEKEYELYNLRLDPDETKDLHAPDHPQAARLKRLLRDWVRFAPTDRRGPTAEDLKALRSLGYVGDSGG